MENTLAELGWIGVFIFMVFQYIIKPMVTHFVERGKPDPLEDLQCKVNEMYKVYALTDDKQRPIVWGFHITEAVDKLVEKLDELLREIKEG